MKTLIIFLVGCLFSSSIYCVEEVSETLLERNQQLLDFQAIRDVLKSDSLEQSVETQKVEVQSVKKNREQGNKMLFQLPSDREFWSFFSEYWLVKNAPVLKYDFIKPDYGIKEAFKIFLEGLGIYNQGFRILLLNTPAISHFALPSNPNEDVILILSVPFIRALDLSKTEISLLLFEDYLRSKQGYFKSMAYIPELEGFLGGNYQGKTLDRELLAKLSKKYDEIIYDKGFQFQQQFEITRQMDTRLKPDLNLWNTYFLLNQKIDNLVKRNVLYQKYNQIYPSAELKMNWLKPKNSVL